MKTYIDKDRLCERLEKRYHEVKKYCGGPNITTQEGWKFCPSCGALMLEEE